MDTSSIDPTSDSGADSDNDGEEQIPMAVPVASIVATNPTHDDDESDDDGDDDAGLKDHAHADASGGLDTTFDTAGDGDDEIGSHATDLTPPPPSSKKRSLSEISDPTPASGANTTAASSSSKKKRVYNDGRPRQPAAKGLTIPFRTIKRIMKIDSNIGIIQNDAAIVTTAALEHFVKKIAVKSLDLAKSKGRNTIKYDDVAEVRAADRSLSFLDLLMP